MTIVLLVCMLSWCGCSGQRPLTVLTESEALTFVKPGESFTNATSAELVVISKGSYVLMFEAAYGAPPAE